MSGAGARATQNAVRSKTGVMTAAALFYLSGAMETEAEPAASDQTTTEQAPTPAPQQTAPAQSPSTQTDHRLGPSQPAACARRGASGAIPAGGRSPAARPAGGDGPGRIGRL